jgi:hypothetical protein
MAAEVKKESQAISYEELLQIQEWKAEHHILLLYSVKDK